MSLSLGSGITKVTKYSPMKKELVNYSDIVVGEMKEILFVLLGDR